MKRTDVRLHTRAFTLVEVLIVVVMLSIIAAVALPGLGPTANAQLRGAASQLVSDLEYAQSSALSQPTDHCVLRLRTAGDGYWVARASAPNIPVLREVIDEPYLVVYGLDDNAHLEGVDLSVSGVVGSTVEFDEFGRLATPADAVFTLTFGGQTLVVRVSPNTGAATIE